MKAVASDLTQEKVRSSPTHVPGLQGYRRGKRHWAPGKEALFSILEDIIHFSLESIRRHEMTFVFTILNIENFNSES